MNGSVLVELGDTAHHGGRELRIRVATDIDYGADDPGLIHSSNGIIHNNTFFILLRRKPGVRRKAEIN
jgi:hypothetical protein